MKQKYILGLIALSFVTVLGVGIISAFGMGNGFMNSEMTEEERVEMQEQHEAMKIAISDGNYETWKFLMEERIAEMQFQITEENFNKIREQHQEMSEFRTAMQEARESGDFSEIEELQEEYGFEGRSFGKGMKAGFKMGMRNCPSAE